MAGVMNENDEIVFTGVSVGHLANMMEALAPGDDAAAQMQMRVRLCNQVAFGVDAGAWSGLEVGGATPLAAYSRPFTGFVVLNEKNYTIGLLPAKLDGASTLEAGMAKDVYLPFKAIKAHISSHSDAACDMRFGGDGVCQMRVGDDDVEIPLMEDGDEAPDGGAQPTDVFKVINHLFGRAMDVQAELVTQSFYDKLKRMQTTTAWLGIHAAERSSREKVAIVTLAEAKPPQGDAVAAFGTVLALTERLHPGENIATLRRLQLTGAGPPEDAAQEAAGRAVMGVGADLDADPRAAARSADAAFDLEALNSEDDVDGSGGATPPAAKRAKVPADRGDGGAAKKAAGTLVKQLAPLALARTEAQAQDVLHRAKEGDETTLLRAYDVPCVLETLETRGLAIRYALFASMAVNMQNMMNTLQAANRVSDTIGVVATSNAHATVMAFVVPFKNSEGSITWVQSGMHAQGRSGDGDDM